MRALADMFATTSQAASYLLGGVVLAAAGLAVVWSLHLEDIAGWAFEVLGAGFIGLLTLLVLGIAYCLVQLRHARGDGEVADFWFLAGVQLASGVATLALTYTLFGISLGIGSLAAQGLTPDTVQGIIRDLTASFSLAFMTTVIGLPLSAALRTILVVVHGRQRLQTRSIALPREV
jgi:hypothetical protein